MTIQICYVPDEPHHYESFNDILVLPNYYLIKYINCSGCNLRELPPVLPSGLLELNCVNNLLTYLPELPDTLKKLRCSFNMLRELPELPVDLEELYCDNNQLSELPDLLYDVYSNFKYECIHNSRLRKINCNNNQLTILPKLPKMLYHLECKNNMLTRLPKLPMFIRTVDISYNHFKQFPKNIHNHLGLTNFICNDNEITQQIPNLPESCSCFSK
jgi:Leucine-rich repeat (LRR) protein